MSYLLFRFIVSFTCLSLLEQLIYRNLCRNTICSTPGSKLIHSYCRSFRDQRSSLNKTPIKLRYKIIQQKIGVIFKSIDPQNIWISVNIFASLKVIPPKINFLFAHNSKMTPTSGKEFHANLFSVFCLFFLQ